MARSDFSRSRLVREIRIEDLPEHGVLDFKHLRDHYLDGIAAGIEAGTFSFKPPVVSHAKGFKVYGSAKLGDQLVLRRLGRMIRRAYGIQPSDRGEVVQQTLRLLEEGVPKFVLRLDLRRFYESLDRPAILNKIAQDRRLPRNAVELLEKYFLSLSGTVAAGLPRGMALSATLSELAMLPVDKGIRLIDGVYYSARYVDDIIIFHRDREKKVQPQVEALLPTGLHLNPAKCCEIYVGCRCQPTCLCKGQKCKCADRCKCEPEDKSNQTLDFLGYRYTFSDIVRAKKAQEPLKIGVELAPKKVARIKRKLTQAFLDYIKVPDFPLLRDRLRFLTENHPLYSPRNRGRLKTGIYFNYLLCDSPDKFDRLDKYLRSHVFAKTGAFGMKLAPKLTKQQRLELAKITFWAGYSSRRTREVSTQRAKEIRACWPS